MNVSIDHISLIYLRGLFGRVHFLPCKLQILISRTLKYFSAVSEISNFKNESAESYFNIFHEYAFINQSFFKTVIRIRMILKLI